MLNSIKKYQRMLELRDQTIEALNERLGRGRLSRMAEKSTNKGYEATTSRFRS